MTVQEFYPDTPEAYETLTEALYSNPELEKLCHEYAVKLTFPDVEMDEPLWVQFKRNPHLEADVIYVLNEDWSTDKMVSKGYEDLHTTYWHNRALWWMELIGHFNVKNQMEFARIGSIANRRTR